MDAHEKQFLNIVAKCPEISCAIAEENAEDANTAQKAENPYIKAQAAYVQRVNVKKVAKRYRF